MLLSTQQYCKEVIQGKRQGIIPTAIKLLLHPLSWVYQSAVLCRNWAYDRQWVRCYSPPVPAVISIGNLVAGGTGKTPAVELLARELIQDYPIAILSRGYRSQAEADLEPTILSKGHGPIHDAALCGDEPYMLSVHLPKAQIIVGKNRRQASIIAAKSGAQIIILDDGMQHRRIARDFEVVVLNAHDLFGLDYFLPRGFLRESKKSLSRADFIILNHVQSPSHFEELAKKIRPFSQAPLIGTAMKICSIRDEQQQPVAKEKVRGRKAGIFCGIANPDLFKASILDLGIRVKAEEYAPDHVSLKPEQLLQFANKCKEQGIEFLICTEKDKVKLDANTSCPLPILYLQAELQIVEGQQEWKNFIAAIKSKIL